MTLDDIKAQRPDCVDGRKHAWVSFRAVQVGYPNGYRKCINCGYEEKIVYAFDV